jgi:N-acetylmuramoyl-L-alanine amidase
MKFQKKMLQLLTVMIGLVGLCYLLKEGTLLVNNMKIENTKKVVVIDVGHGGNDPGKVGINNALEKDVNLAIALKLKTILEQQDIEVVMTREEDKGLYKESDNNKKVADMKARCALIEEIKPVMTVSIHQNSYHTSDISGAQVFYYSRSEQGKTLAEIMQKQLIRVLDSSNTRAAKANDSYYLLKNTTCPIVIVECGFLSNQKEAELLCDERYQEKVAWAVHMGVMEYINQKQ